ncbi:filaggrin-2 [Prionailurus iriomotensis]
MRETRDTVQQQKRLKIMRAFMDIANKGKEQVRKEGLLQHRARNITTKMTVKPRQINGRHIQQLPGSIMKMTMKNQEEFPQVKMKDRLRDRQETTQDMPILAMDRPPGQNPVGPEKRDLAAVSPVTGEGFQESHRHRQGPLMAMLDLNMESRDPPRKRDRQLLTDRQETPLDIPSLGLDKPPGQNPAGLEEENPVSVSPVTMKGTQESHRQRQGPLMATLDSNRESQDPPMKEDGKLLTESKETPLDNLILVMDRPPGQKLAGPKEADPVSVNQVTGKGTQDSHRHTQSPLMARLDLSMKSQDPPVKEDRVLLTDSKETPLDIHCLVMDRPPGQNPAGHEEQDLGAVSPVTGEGIQESHRQRQGPLMAMLDLNMESRDPPGKEDQKLLTDSKETPLDKLILVLDRPPGQNLAGPKEADPVPVNRVTGKDTQESHRHTQSPLMARLDLNMESRDPPGKEDRELLTDRQETPLDIPSPLMDKPPGQNPVGLGEENPVSVSPVTVKGTQESHTHRQGPLMAMLDFNMESRDPPRKEDRELLTDRQETPLDIPSLGMDKPPSQNPVGLGEENPVSVSPVTVKGTQESHTHRQGPLRAMLDLTMESRDPPRKEDQKLLRDRQETPLDIPSLGMDKPPGQNPVGLGEENPVSVSPVTVKGTQESHRHRQGPLMATLDSNRESQDPH